MGFIKELRSSLEGGRDPEKASLQRQLEIAELKKKLATVEDGSLDCTESKTPEPISAHGIPWPGPAVALGRFAEKLYNEKTLPKSVTSASAAIRLLCSLFLIDGKHPDPEDIRRNLATAKSRSN